MSGSKALTDLQALVKAGELKFVQILGVPRANTTVMCRLLGNRLHGAVYEPSFPSTLFPASAYFRKILNGYRAVRATVPADEPVSLAIKDLSGLMTRRQQQFVLEHADHIVFAIREPALQYASYASQLLVEFSSANGWRSVFTTPWDAAMYVLHFGRRLPLYHRLAFERFGISWSQYRRMNAVGSDLDFWFKLVAHFAEAERQLPASRLTVFDASLSRLMPAEAERGFDVIAASIAPSRSTADRSLEVAGHPRMSTSSPWAVEALTSKSLKKFTAAPKFESPYDDFGEWLPRIAGAMYPGYLDMFFHPSHRLREAFLATPRPLTGDAQASLGHLLESGSADAALALARERGRIAA